MNTIDTSAWFERGDYEETFDELFSPLNIVKIYNYLSLKQTEKGFLLPPYFWQQLELAYSKLDISGVERFEEYIAPLIAWVDSKIDLEHKEFMQIFLEQVLAVYQGANTSVIKGFIMATVINFMNQAEN